jgi:hypothetical protein
MYHVYCCQNALTCQINYVLPHPTKNGYFQPLANIFCTRKCPVLQYMATLNCLAGFIGGYRPTRRGRSSSYPTFALYKLSVQSGITPLVSGYSYGTEMLFNLHVYYVQDYTSGSKAILLCSLIKKAAQERIMILY